MKRSAFAKIATLALALVLVLSLAACGKVRQRRENSGPQ